MSEENNDELIDEVNSFLENFSPLEMSEDESNSTSTAPVFEFASPLDIKVTRAITYIETYFWRVGELPSFTDKPIDELDIQEIQELVNPKLKGRGIPEFRFTGISAPVGEDEFDPRFVLACNVLCSVSGKSKGARFKDLASIGVNEQMWNGWLNIPSYRNYAMAKMDAQYRSVTEVDAKMALARNVANGDLSSIKYFHEVTGLYRPQDQNVVNLMALVAALMEILARNVSAEVFDKIASELETTPVGELLKAS